MNFTYPLMDYLPFLCVALVYIVGRAFDIHTSLNGQYYGVSEGNKLWADKDGNFVMWKNVAASTAFLGLCVVLTYVHPAAGWALLAVPAAGSFIVAFINRSKKRANRVKQIATLRHLATGQPYEFPYIITRNGKSYFPNFRWIYSENPHIETATQEVVDRLYALAKLPQSEWFPA